MKFGYKSLIAAGILSAGLGVSAASAMPAIGTIAPVAASAGATVEKAAIVCVGRCYRRRVYARPRVYHPYRAYRAYRPYRVHLY